MLCVSQAFYELTNLKNKNQNTGLNNANEI